MTLKKHWFTYAASLLLLAYIIGHPWYRAARDLSRLSHPDVRLMTGIGLAALAMGVLAKMWTWRETIRLFEALSASGNTLTWWERWKMSPRAAVVLFGVVPIFPLLGMGLYFAGHAPTDSVPGSAFIAAMWTIFGIMLFPPPRIAP